MTEPRAHAAPPTSDDSPASVRERVRAGYRGVTSGLAPGFLQGNLVVLSAHWATAFVDFCRANPSPLPLMGVSPAGDPTMPSLGDGVDVRHDLGGYEVCLQGDPPVRVTSLDGLWQPDDVAIVLGCWFSNEARLAAAGVRMRHIEQGIQGGLFRSNIACATVGPFGGPLVVSMRPFADPDVDAVVALTSCMPMAHGAPVHRGNASADLGIVDWAVPDWGEPLPPLAGETALCWGCGLTATEALRRAGVPRYITHQPGRMLVTDLPAPPITRDPRQQPNAMP